MCPRSARTTPTRESRIAGGPSPSTPDNFGSLRNKANPYRNLGEFDKSVQDYDNHIRLRTRCRRELEPDYCEAYYQRDVARVELGGHRRAVEDFDEFICLNPGDPFVCRDRQFATAEADGR